MTRKCVMCGKPEHPGMRIDGRPTCSARCRMLAFRQHAKASELGKYWIEKVEPIACKWRSYVRSEEDRLYSRGGSRADRERLSDLVLAALIDPSGQRSGILADWLTDHFRDEDAERLRGNRTAPSAILNAYCMGVEPETVYRSVFAALDMTGTNKQRTERILRWLAGKPIKSGEGPWMFLALAKLQLRHCPITSHDATNACRQQMAALLRNEMPR